MRLFYWTLLLFVLWLILSANLQIANILLGATLSFAVAFIYTKLFVHKDFEAINPFWFFVYLLVLVKNLIISNLQIAKRVLSPDMKLAPAIVAVKTELTSDWKKLLLANSVTLTPGTLTLDIQDDTLYIHVIEYNESSQKEEITQEFEKVIAKI
jgi:multicomponent Na+:H+ antiporter subunit E